MFPQPLISNSAAEFSGPFRERELFVPFFCLLVTHPMTDVYQWFLEELPR